MVVLEGRQELKKLSFEFHTSDSEEREFYKSYKQAVKPALRVKKEGRMSGTMFLKLFHLIIEVSFHCESRSRVQIDKYVQS